MGIDCMEMGGRKYECKIHCRSSVVGYRAAPAIDVTRLKMAHRYVAGPWWCAQGPHTSTGAVAAALATHDPGQQCRKNRVNL